MVITFFWCFSYIQDYFNFTLLIQGMDETRHPSDEKVTVFKVCYNISLVLLFYVQHLGMSRAAFKRMFTNVLYHEKYEKAVFTIISSLMSINYMISWKPMTPVLIDFGQFGWLMRSLGWLGIIILLTGLTKSGHFNLENAHVHRKLKLHYDFHRSGLNRYIRHPTYLGIWVLVTFSDKMTAGRLLHSFLTLTFLLVAIYLFEEPAILKEIDDKEQYQQYLNEVYCLYPAKLDRSQFFE